jgi:hypothetical protein
MKSNKQRRAELALRRRKRKEKLAAAAAHDPRIIRVGAEAAPCNPKLLAADNSYGRPAFVARGYYVDKAFACVDCKTREVWRATQQKWWYEVAKGNVWTTARRCRTCRRAERERKTEARRVHLEGVEKKLAARKTR